jgi:hypothetical protein
MKCFLREATLKFSKQNPCSKAVREMKPAFGARWIPWLQAAGSDLRGKPALVPTFCREHGAPGAKREATTTA